MVEKQTAVHPLILAAVATGAAHWDFRIGDVAHGPVIEFRAAQIAEDHSFAQVNEIGDVRSSQRARGASAIFGIEHAALIGPGFEV